MTPTDAMTEASTDRERALAPFLERLRSCGDLPADATSIDLGDRVLSLEPWAREILRKYKTGVDEVGHPWPGLAREGLAFIAKVGTRDSENEEEPAATDDLILAAAAGAAILGDLQVTLQELILDGRMKQAKLLSDLRNRINPSVTAMKSRLDANSRSSIDARAAAMLTVRQRQETTPAPESNPQLEAERSSPTTFRRDPAPVRVIHRGAAESKTLSRALLVVLIISAATWIALTVTHTPHVGPPVLTNEQFGHVAIVESIEARPPSLFVTVEGAAWDGLNEAQRLDAIRQTASIAEQAGYVGAQFWTRDGSVAGRWSKKQGAELVGTAPEGS